MNATTSIESVYQQEERRFDELPSKNVRLIALLFCRPELGLMRDHIIPSLPYFDRRSGGNTAFYFAGFETHLGGYFRDLKSRDLLVSDKAAPVVFAAPEGSSIPVGGDGDPGCISIVGPQDDCWHFDPSSFNCFRNAVEKATRWRYSGGCDMILVNSRRRLFGESWRTIIDFRTAVVLRLDKIGELVTTPTISQLFETIFQYAERQDDDNPTWGLSDHLGLKIATSGLWEALLGVLPNGVRASLRAARHLVVQDIGVPATRIDS